MPIGTPYMQYASAAPIYNPEHVGAEDVNAASAGQAAQSAGTTAQTQLAGILNKGGALMQQSATMGNQQAASRGLLNSSMGIQAAQNAMIQNASPIAQHDASLIQNNQQFNASATNQQGQYNASNQQQANMANQAAENRAREINAGAQNDWTKFNATNQNAMNQWNAGQQNEATLKTLDINSREQLMNMEANYKTLMQANSSASSLWEQTLKNMSDIQSSDKLDAGSKQAALNNQMTSLRYGMTMLQNMNGITGLVTF